jgi:hypothetical protein
MSYDDYHDDIPVVYIDENKQKWFESLRHISKFDIPKNSVPISKLKKFGIKAKELEAVAWVYQSFTHEVCLLFNLNLYKPKEKAIKLQFQNYKNYIKKNNLNNIN